MMKYILMIGTLIAVISVNAAANIMPINGSTTAGIASRLPVLFTPASFVSIIWFFVYGLLVYWLFSFRKQQDTSYPKQSIRAILFIVSGILNIVWIFLWHYEYFSWTIPVKGALLLVLAALYFTYPKQENNLANRAPVSVYLGWTFVSLMINTSYVLTLHEWRGWGISDPLWTVIYLTIATAFALHFLYHHKDYPLVLVFIWTFSGIAVKNGFEELFVTAASLFLTAVLIASIFIRRNAKPIQE